MKSLFLIFPVAKIMKDRRIECLTDIRSPQFDSIRQRAFTTIWANLLAIFSERPIQSFHSLCSLHCIPYNICRPTLKFAERTHCIVSITKREEGNDVNIILIGEKFNKKCFIHREIYLHLIKPNTQKLYYFLIASEKKNESQFCEANTAGF